MTQNEVNIIKNAVLDATEAYVDARLATSSFVKTQIGVVSSYYEDSNNHKYYHTVKCDNNRVAYTNVLSVGNIPFPANSIVFLIAPNAQFSNQFILGKLDTSPCNISGGTLNIGDGAFVVNSDGSLHINGNTFVVNPNGSLNINGNTFVIDSNGNMSTSGNITTSGSMTLNGSIVANGNMTARNLTAIGGYIGNTTDGFIIYGGDLSIPAPASIYTVGGPSNINNSWSRGIYISQQGIRLNNGQGSTVGILPSEISCPSGTMLCKSLNVTDGYTIASSAYDTTVAFLQYYQGTYQNKYIPWTGVSDRRVKKNITYINSKFTKNLFKKLKPVKFNYINDKYNKLEYGLIAQDLEQSLEELGVKNTSLVGEIENCKYIDYTKMIGLCISAIKDLYETVDEQQKEIEDLKKKLKD